MSVNIIKPKIMVYSVDETQETTRLIPPVHSESQSLSYSAIIFCSIDRCFHLVLYSIFTTFSWYWSKYFAIDYAIFSIIAIMHLFGNIFNIFMVKYYERFKIKYIIMFFELLLTLSIVPIIFYHDVISLLIARLITGIAISALISIGNGIIGKYTFAMKRTISISIIEMSGGLSGIAMLAVAAILQYYDWRVCIVGFTLIAFIFTLISLFLIPSWNIEYDRDQEIERKKIIKYAYKYSKLKQTMGHSRLRLVFLAMFMDKIAKNAFYFTLSVWFAISFKLGPFKFALVTLYIYAAYLVTSFLQSLVMPIIGRKIKLNIFFSCLFGSILQIGAMMVKPIYYMTDRHMPFTTACIVIFIYFIGTQIWYNNISYIRIGVTPFPSMLPAVNTVSLIFGTFGVIIGTVSSALCYEWNKESGVAMICVVCNIIAGCLVILLLIANKQHTYLTVNMLRIMGVQQLERETTLEDRVLANVRKMKPKRKPKKYKYDAIFSKDIDLIRKDDDSEDEEPSLLVEKASLLQDII